MIRMDSLAVPGGSVPQRLPVARCVTGHPLGPLLIPVRDLTARQVRVRAAIILAGCLAVLGLAAYLTPDPSGVGTHRQLGFPTCGLILTTGLPCPTCGMTTAFAHAVRGHLLAAFAAQPFGAVLALATMAAVCVEVGVLWTGRARRVNWYRVSPGWTVFGVLLFMGLAWGYKIIATLAAGSS
ncbi:MAG: DUF2752 domain-containing protein [Phycisphaerae bacterium]|nr:DUF2752 domain-containing protein [Phycisphaerae bacterium]